MKALRSIGLVCSALLLATAITSSAMAASSAEGKQTLDELIAKAKKEGVLDTTVVSQAGKTGPKLVVAFKKRFGLDGLTVNMNVGGQSNEETQIMAALKAGAPPHLDAFTGSDDYIVKIVEAGLAAEVPNWQAVISEINPLVSSGQVTPEQVSPSLFAGYGFLWAGRNKVLVYNPTLIKKEDLPKSRADIADPKYKNNFILSIFVSEWQYGVLVHDKDEWLKTVDMMGKNALAVMHLTEGRNRLLLGEFAFLPGNEYHYLESKEKDPDAPIAYTFFSDGTASTKLLYVVPKAARHPAAAMLFSMWMSTPEAEEIWQPGSFYTNVHFGQSKLDKEMRASLEESHSKLISFYDTPETMKWLAWYATDEGRNYRSALDNATRQRK